MLKKSSAKDSSKPNLDERLMPDFVLILDEGTEEFFSGGNISGGNISLKRGIDYEAEGKIRGTLILSL